MKGPVRSGLERMSRATHDRDKTGEKHEARKAMNGVAAARRMLTRNSTFVVTPRGCVTTIAGIDAQLSVDLAGEQVPGALDSPWR